MLYDVFICHASEDKNDFVRPLAEALRNEHVEVWYDEFSLSLGDSIRRTIDKGLRQSRFGVVVLSRAFFAKQWPQYELDGLTELEIQGQDKVLLPIWHGVTHSDVLAFSPPMAGRIAALSSKGTDHVVAQILNIIRPQGSPFIRARDVLIEWGLTPPVITDEYWLDVVEASNRIPGYGAHIPEESHWGRWSFPLPDKDGGAINRGERLAWCAMQMQWTEFAEREHITPLTHPDEVHKFISSHPGLLETCSLYPELVAEYAPQLTISGFEGILAASIEEAFQKSCAEAKRTAITNPQFGSSLTVDGHPPLCDEEWSLHHPTFGNYRPYTIAHAYFGGTMFGPDVSPYEDAEHLIWLLSSASAWLPQQIYNVLLEGLGSSRFWLWTADRATNQNSDEKEALFNAVHEAIETGKPFKWTNAVKRDVATRIQYAIETLHLLDAPETLQKKFVVQDLPNKMIKEERRLQKQRADRAK